MIQEIKDIYSYRKEDNSAMLSMYDADFWKPYRDNFAYYDRLFMKKYRSWFPLDQEGDLEEVAVDFAYDVKSMLMVNNKRYSELFRINSIADDEKYSLTDNVYEVETIEKEYGRDVTFNKGEQEDSDSGETDYGLHETTDNRDLSYGEQIIGVEGGETLGATEKTTVNETSAFNESGYEPVDRRTESDDEVTNTNTSETTNGAHEDSDDRTITSKAHKDETSSSHTSGAREDTTGETGSETTTRNRAGNIGVKDVPQMLGDQRDFWVDFSFYEMIFFEIARELLRGWR